MNRLYSKIKKINCDPKIKYKEIDWGTPHNQGKRLCDGTIIGNPDAPRGIKKYPYMDLSEWVDADNKTDFKVLYTHSRAYRYVQARKYRLNHTKACKYAIITG